MDVLPRARTRINWLGSRRCEPGVGWERAGPDAHHLTLPLWRELFSRREAARLGDGPFPFLSSRIVNWVARSKGDFTRPVCMMLA